MDLRAVRTALFAGRTASRWATSTTLNSTASFARYISSTPRRLQEAEAESDPPPSPPTSAPRGSMAAYLQQRQQSQPQQQQQHQEAQDGDHPNSRNIFSLKSSSSSSLMSSSFVPGSRPDQSKAVRPSWAQPSNLARADRKTTNTIDELGWAVAPPAAAPTLADFQNNRTRLGYPRPEDVKLRLRPVLGRGVKLGDRIDFAKGLKILDTRVNVNKVAREARLQKFHERPGLKRKRLKMLRWRGRFKRGFQATCERVTELAKQGW